MPWRSHPDPYAVWVSEIMCQQTQIATVLPYFERWIDRFPNVQLLADASEDEVLSLWQGLGYYRRAKLLLAGAKHVAQNGWPQSSREWLKVPGVGKYTAAAIASITMHEAAPLVDGNVERVFARLQGSRLRDAALHSAAWDWAVAVMLIESPGEWNQALMELGALVCTPALPKCGVCPISQSCRAFAEGIQTEIPVPATRRESVLLSEVVVVVRWAAKWGLRQIQDGPWWRGMWEFPRFQSLPDWADGAVPLGRVRHTVTHHKISLDVFVVEANRAELRYFLDEELAQLALPSPQRKVFALAQSSLFGG
ncbi:MAG: A/G-specific adenine glycosylase [Armatimonadetes bacterium]|nr:A/G-specific adenine glycosylase [Armatimonadota bacterium]